MVSTGQYKNGKPQCARGCGELIKANGLLYCCYCGTSHDGYMTDEQRENFYRQHIKTATPLIAGK